MKKQCIILALLFLGLSVMACSGNPEILPSATDTSVATTPASPNLEVPMPFLRTEIDTGNELLNMLLKTSPSDLSELPAYSFEDYVAWIENPGCDVTEELNDFNQKFPIRHIEVTIFNDDELVGMRTFMTVTKLSKEGFEQPIYAYLPFQKEGKQSYKRLIPYYCTRTLTSADFDSISKGDSFEKVRTIEPAAGIAQQLPQEYNGVIGAPGETPSQDVILILDDGIIIIRVAYNNGERVVRNKFFYHYTTHTFRTSGAPAMGYVNEWVRLAKWEKPILP